MKARLTNRSINQLAAIRDFIMQESPQRAEMVRLRILHTIARLRNQPRLGRPGRASNTRELRVSGLNYIVIYRIENQSIIILSIFHAAQER
jgi:toxin ParE1/3/4